MRIDPENLLLVILAAINLVGLTYRVSWVVPVPWRTAFWALPTGILLISAATMLVATPSLPAAVKSNNERTVLAAILATLVLTIYQTTSGSATLVVIPVLLASMTLALRFTTMRRTVDALLVVAIAFTAAYILQGDYRQIGGDLLPIIVAAGRNFLAGVDPYNADYSQVTRNPFFYLPLQWLPFVPAAGFGFDPRAITVTLFLLFVGVIRTSASSCARYAPAMLFVSLFVAAPFGHAMARTYMFPAWVLLTAFTYALVVGQDIAAAVLLGCLLATRQTFFADAAALLIGIVWQMPIGRVLLLAAVTAATAATVLAPFLVWDPFLLGRVFLQGPAQALAGNQGNPIATGQVGLAPLLAGFGLSVPSNLLQGMGILMALAGVAARRPIGRVPLALSVASVDLLTALSGGQTFEYYWGSSFVIACGALCFGRYHCEHRAIGHDPANGAGR